MAATTDKEREARRRLVYHYHFVQGMSARRIAKQPDIDADFSTITRDIKALKKDAPGLDLEYYTTFLMEQMGEAADLKERIIVFDRMLKVSPPTTGESNNEGAEFLGRILKEVVTKREKRLEDGGIAE